MNIYCMSVALLWRTALRASAGSARTPQAAHGGRRMCAQPLSLACARANAGRAMTRCT
jgi:hypothetical protein